MTAVPGFPDFVRELRAASRGAGLGLLIVRSVDSTNRLAGAMVRELREDELAVPPCALVAYEQTGGRGRGGHSWQSPPGAGVYASVILPVSGVEELRRLPLLAGVTLCRELSRYVDGKCRLKWPNDLVVSSRKLGGLLIESAVRADALGEAVVGFGVNWRDDPAVDAPGATALETEGRPPGLGELAWRLVAAVWGEREALQDPPTLAREYAAVSAHRPGDTLRWRTAERTLDGRFAGFTPEGHLRLDVAGAEQVVAAGEVVEWSAS